MTTEQTSPRSRAKKRSMPVSSIYRRTIAVELFNQWRQLARKGDPDAIANLLKVSKPTINKALIYGNVNSEAVKTGITQYFADRLRKELDDAEELEKLRKLAGGGQPKEKIDDADL